MLIERRQISLFDLHETLFAHGFYLAVRALFHAALQYLIGEQFPFFCLDMWSKTSGDLLSGNYWDSKLNYISAYVQKCYTYF